MTRAKLNVCRDQQFLSAYFKPSVRDTKGVAAIEAIYEQLRKDGYEVAWDADGTKPYKRSCGFVTSPDDIPASEWIEIIESVEQTLGKFFPNEGSPTMARKHKPWIVSKVRRGLHSRAAVYRTDDDGRETGRPLVVARDGATVDDVNFAMKSIKKLPADDTAAKVAVRKALAARFLVCGRGRPQLDKATPMTLYLEADLRKTIDDLRGKMPRSTWIRQACQYVAKNEKAAALVSEPWEE